MKKMGKNILKLKSIEMIGLKQNFKVVTQKVMG